MISLPLAALTEELSTKLHDFKVMSITLDEWRLIGVEYGMRVGLAVIIIFLSLTVAGWASSVVASSLSKLKFDATLTKFLAKLTRWSILCMAALTCLSYFGIQTTSFAAVIAAAGMAIALGFQGTLSSLAAGSMLLVFRPYKVGDTVVVAGQAGVVDEIELFTTSIDTGDNRRIIIPNNTIFGSVIENSTHHPKRRVDVPVGVGYAADIDHTRQVLLHAAAQTPGILKDPAPVADLISLADSSVSWSVRVWAPTADAGAVKQALIRAVKIALDDAGIEIPYQQMDLNLRSLPRELAQDQRRAA